VGLYKSGTVTFSHTYNDYWNNTSNCSEALHGTEITTNPSLGNLPTGCVIDTATCNRPDGYAISGYDMNGSDTFDNLGIDEAVYTGSGYRYAGTKNIQMGPEYALSTFPETFGICTPNSGTTAGGTSVTISGGVGWGAAQGAGYVQIDGTDVVESAWSDAGCTFTTPAHAFGAVNVVCVNNRGTTITGTAAYTYSAPTITTITPRHGYVGDSITITGISFGATQGTVTIGGKLPLSYTSWADTSIVVIVPAGSGSNTVIVTVP
jgi:hypothetical protein